MEHTSTEAQSLVTAFPADLAHANHSLHTCRAYAADLAQLCGFHQGPIQTITADVLRTFFEMHADLRPATRARKQAAVTRFLTWADQQGRGGSIRYQSMQKRWDHYCSQAGVACTRLNSSTER